MGKQTRRNQKIWDTGGSVHSRLFKFRHFLQNFRCAVKMLAQINRTFSRVQKPGGNASRCRSWYVCGLPFSKFCSNAVFWAGFASYSSWTSQSSWRGSLRLRRYIGLSVYHITTMPVQAKSNCKNIKRSIKRSKYVRKYSWKKLKLKENAEPSTCVHVKLIEV